MPGGCQMEISGERFSRCLGKGIILLVYELEDDDRQQCQVDSILQLR